MKRRYSFLCLVVLVLLAAGYIAGPALLPVQAADSQLWQFTDDTYDGKAASDGTTHVSDKLMKQEPNLPTGPKATVTIPGNATAWWYMDETALTNIALGMEEWNVEVHACVSEDTDTGNLTITVWQVNTETGVCKQLSSGTLHNQEIGTSDSQHYVLALTPDEDQNITAGWTVACSVSWDGTQDLSIAYNEIMGEGSCDSWCQSPCSDPGYPSPEPATIILSAIGMAAIAGFLYWNHRSQRKTISG